MKYQWNSDMAVGHERFCVHPYHSLSTYCSADPVTQPWTTWGLPSLAWREDHPLAHEIGNCPGEGGGMRALCSCGWSSIEVSPWSIDHLAAAHRYHLATVEMRPEASTDGWTGD